MKVIAVESKGAIAMLFAYLARNLAKETASEILFPAVWFIRDCIVALMLKVMELLLRQFLKIICCVVKVSSLKDIKWNIGKLGKPIQVHCKRALRHRPTSLIVFSDRPNIRELGFRLF